MRLFDFFKKNPKNTNNPVNQNNPVNPNSPDRSIDPAKPVAPIKPVTSADPAEQLAAQLETLGYFTYTDPADKPQVKSEITTWLTTKGHLPHVEMEISPYRSLDPRHYILDNEDLYEQGGIVETLARMAPVFAKMNVRMKISDHYEVWDQSTGLDHRITLNGKPYTIFHQWKDYGWSESAQRFADIVNDQFALQNSKERLYLIGGGNDGRAVFLTDELYALIRPYTEGNKQLECPLPTKEWCEVMQMTWENVTG